MKENPDQEQRCTGAGCMLRWPGNPIVKEKCIHPDCGSQTHCNNNPNGEYLPCTVEICEAYDSQGVCRTPVATTRDWAMIGDGTRINAECVDPRFLSTSPFLAAQMGCRSVFPSFSAIFKRKMQRLPPFFVHFNKK